MATYLRKPTNDEIEANQWDGVHGVPGVLSDVLGLDGHPATERSFVRTIQGQEVEVQPGEWIIQEPDGEHYYPCADDVFKARYIALAVATHNYITVKFQKGPIKENGVNGCQVEDVIQVAIDRLRELNVAPYNDRNNSLAITYLEDAQDKLFRRTREREARGVEGTNTP